MANLFSSNIALDWLRVGLNIHHDTVFVGGARELSRKVAVKPESDLPGASFEEGDWLHPQLCPPTQHDQTWRNVAILATFSGLWRIFILEKEPRKMAKFLATFCEGPIS